MSQECNQLFRILTYHKRKAGKFKSTEVDSLKTIHIQATPRKPPCIQENKSCPITAHDGGVIFHRITSPCSMGHSGPGHQFSSTP